MDPVIENRSAPEQTAVPPSSHAVNLTSFMTSDRLPDCLNPFLVLDLVKTNHKFSVSSPVAYAMATAFAFSLVSITGYFLWNPIFADMGRSFEFHARDFTPFLMAVLIFIFIVITFDGLASYQRMFTNREITHVLLSGMSPLRIVAGLLSSIIFKCFTAFIFMLTANIIVWEAANLHNLFIFIGMSFLIFMLMLAFACLACAVLSSALFYKKSALPTAVVMCGLTGLSAFPTVFLFVSEHDFFLVKYGVSDVLMILYVVTFLPTLLFLTAAASLEPQKRGAFSYVKMAVLIGSFLAPLINMIPYNGAISRTDEKYTLLFFFMTLSAIYPLVSVFALPYGPDDDRMAQKTWITENRFMRFIFGPGFYSNLIWYCLVLIPLSVALIIPESTLSLHITADYYEQRWSQGVLNIPAMCLVVFTAVVLPLRHIPILKSIQTETLCGIVFVMLVVYCILGALFILPGISLVVSLAGSRPWFALGVAVTGIAVGTILKLRKKLKAVSDEKIA